MKKRNIGLTICCIVVCCIALLAIFRGYYVWAEDILDQLMYDNQKAYAQSQRNEVIAKVGDVSSTLKTMAAVLEECASEEEMSKFDSVMETMGESEDIQAEGVRYFSFRDLNIDVMSDGDKAVLRRLQSGESVISDIYTSSADRKTYYGIAEPVYLNGECIGFVRGLIDSTTLLYSSQVGLFREEAESYLMHVNGDNAFQDNSDEGEVINMYDSLKKICDEPEVIDELAQKMKDGNEIEVVQTTFQGTTVLISCISLPYNDWIILNSVCSEKLNQYIADMAIRGRNTILFIICSASFVIILLVVVYYFNNREHRFEQKRAMLLANFSDTVLCEYDIKKDRMSCSSNITKMLSVTDTLVENFSSFIVKAESVHPDDMEVLKEMLSVIPEEGEVLEYELRLKNCKEEFNWYDIHVTALSVKGKQQERLILKINDITDSKKKELGLVQRAESDGLTGLLNRETFKDKVEQRLTVDKGGYLFLLDLDDFKEINDTYGHQCGDEILRMTAKCLRKSFRGEDYTGRYGGDEFLVFMPAPASIEAVRERAMILTGAVSSLQLENNGNIKLTCSVGVAKYEGGTYADLLKKADEAMYKAKEAGKNSWVLE